MAGTESESAKTAEKTESEKQEKDKPCEDSKPCESAQADAASKESEKSGADSICEQSTDKPKDCCAETTATAEASSESDVTANTPSDKTEATSSGTEDGAIQDRPLVQTGRFKILDEILENPPPPQSGLKKLRFPMIFDLVLAAGLLVAMIGFSAGLFRLLITHMAEQSILQRDFKAAITLLKESPFTTVFSFGNNESEELLAQALYLDAIDKLGKENQSEVENALKELEQIRPGSRYFSMAQEILTENFVPSSTTLQGNAETVENNPAPPQKDGGFEIEMQIERK